MNVGGLTVTGVYIVCLFFVFFVFFGGGLFCFEI